MSVGSFIFMVLAFVLALFCFLTAACVSRYPRDKWRKGQVRNLPLVGLFGLAGVALATVGLWGGFAQFGRWEDQPAFTPGDDGPHPRHKESPAPTIPEWQRYKAPEE